jgi:membrane-associated phospholipid phosphatase
MIRRLLTEVEVGIGLEGVADLWHRFALTLLQFGRGVGITEPLHSHAPWLVIVAFAVVTQLGDVWFLFLLTGVLYVGGEYVPRLGVERHRGMFVIALVIAYIALIGAIKGVLLFPRPPGANDPPALRWIPRFMETLFTSITTATGPGFPSGHALGTTMVWGGLALVVERGTRRARFAVAGAVVALVSLSRLVLGVHYLVDVLAGTLLGIAVLGGLYWLTERGDDPEWVLIAAVVAGVFGVATDLTFDSVAAIGGAVGGWLAWRGIAESTPAHPSSGVEVAAGFLVAVAAGGIFVAVYALHPSYLYTFLGTAAAVGTVVVAPVVGDRVA